MKYINKNTGVIVDIPSKVAEGGAWELLEASTVVDKPIVSEAPKKRTTKRKEV